MAKDMMQPFELYQPDDLDTALSLAKRHGKDGWLLSARVRLRRSLPRSWWWCR